MKIVSLLPLCATFALVACSGSSGGGSKAIYHPDVGPFDVNGDYVEALADAPVRKRTFARNKKSKAKPAPVQTREPAKVQRLAKVTPPTPPLRPRPVAQPQSRTVLIAQSPRPQAVPVVQALPRPAVTAAPAPVAPTALRPVAPPIAASVAPPVAAPVAPVAPPVVAPVPAVAPPVAAPIPAPTPQPKPVVVKPAKKAPVRHVVKSSDTLFGLSRKYGVSVGAIQRANNIKGSNIITGKSLLIPR